jgi:hypothetical protein
MQPSLHAGIRARPVYVASACLAAVIAAVGFWPSYFGPLLAGGVDKPAFIHLHATVYVGWLALFIAQTAFAAFRRMDLHIAAGNVGIGYGALVIVVGLGAAFGMFALRVHAGDTADATRRLLAPLADMVFFAPLFIAAVRYRRKPEIHKRLMLVATTLLLVAAVGRMPIGHGPARLLLLLLVWASPILLGMIYDALRFRRAHPVFLLGLAIIGTRLALGLLVPGTAAWQATGAWLAGWLV